MLGWLVALSSAVLGDARTVGVLVLTSEGYAVPVSEIYDRARSILEEKTLLDIAPLDLFSEEVRLEVVRTCAGSASCFLEKFGRAADVDVLLVLTIADLPDRRLLAVRLVGARDGADLGQTTGEADLALPLEPSIYDLLSRVFPSTVWGRVGSIAVVTTPASARVELGPRSCVSPCRFDRVALREQRIVVSKEGYSSAERALRVEGVSSIEVLLEPLPEPWIWYESPWIWTAVGVVIVGATVGAYFAFRSEPLDDVCITGDPMECAR